MALKKEKVFVTSGKKKADVRRETSAVSGMRVTIVRKIQNTKPPHFPSPRCREVEVCRRKEVSKARVIMLPFFDNRAEFEESCTRSLCESWHPPECPFYKNESGWKAGDKCFFPHHEVNEQPNKKPKKTNHSPTRKRKRRQKCCSYWENCTSVGLCLVRLGAIGFSKRRTDPGKPDAKSLGKNVYCRLRQ